MIGLSVSLQWFCAIVIVVMTALSPSFSLWVEFGVCDLYCVGLCGIGTVYQRVGEGLFR